MKRYLLLGLVLGAASQVLVWTGAWTLAPAIEGWLRPRLFGAVIGLAAMVFGGIYYAVVMRSESTKRAKAVGTAMTVSFGIFFMALFAVNVSWAAGAWISGLLGAAAGAVVVAIAARPEHADLDPPDELL